ncbi:MAG: dentilisin complex subunit PrcA [Treponema sp.]
MKKLLWLFTLSIFLLFACRQQAQQQGEDLSLAKLMVDGVSLLEKMSKRNSADFGDFDSSKYSVDVVAVPKDENVASVSVATNYYNGSGSAPNFVAYLTNGPNTILITCASKKDPSKKKVYRVTINKKPSTVNDNESSRLQELKFENVDVLNGISTDNIAEFGDIEEGKTEATVVAKAHNSSAKIKVSNGDKNATDAGANTYKVPLEYGANEVHVEIESEKEGKRVYAIRVFRVQDLSLKNFTVNDQEYCDANGMINIKNSLRFAAGSQAVKVVAMAKSSPTTIMFRHNGKEIMGAAGVYNLSLTEGDNRIEVIVEGLGNRTRPYTVTFVLLSQNTLNGGLIKLEADKVDYLSAISKETPLVLPSCNHDKNTLPLNIKATPEYTLTVKCNNTEVQATDGMYNATLQDDKNEINVILSKGGSETDKYKIFITRYPQDATPQIPETDEVKVSFVVSDGVNGSPVDGSYLTISKTKNTSSESPKKVLIRNGKAEANLKKKEYYDFKIEGQNEEYSPIRYAASSIISYYVGESAVTVPMVQRPLQRITKKAEAPVISELKFDTQELKAGEEKDVTGMKDISMKITASAPVEKLTYASPFPMLGIGFVPTTPDGKTDKTGKVISDNIFYAKETTANAVSGEKYTSSWKWECSTATLLTEQYVDVVIVAYDVASNRIEQHIRLKNTNGANQIDEDADVSVTDMKLLFERYPTQSRLYSVGQDEGTGTGSHYKATLSFDVKKSNASVKCKGFDLYRKEEGNGDFTLVKHMLYKTAKEASDTDPTDAKRKTHNIYDTDGLLEDGKKYTYKVVAYTEDKKSKKDSSPEVSVTVPKSTSLVLEYPFFSSVSVNETKNLSYSFRFSNPDALKEAKEMKLGFLIVNRAGKYVYGTKIKYVFDEGGKPALYISETAPESKLNPVEKLIVVDRERGTVKITNDFISITKTNLAITKSEEKKVKYDKGMTYYWDVVDWGSLTEADTDNACEIVMNSEANASVVVPVNDGMNGNNSVNGRAEFSVKSE